MAGLAADLVIANPPPADWTFKGGGRRIGGSQERIEMRSVGYRQRRLRHNLSHCSSTLLLHGYSAVETTTSARFQPGDMCGPSFIWSRNSGISAWFLSLALADVSGGNNLSRARAKGTVAADRS